MNEGNVDIAHVAFLDILREMIAVTGAAATKGTLVRIATKAGKQLNAVDFATWDEFLASVDAAANPMARVEGRAKHYGNGLFGLRACPFASAIAGYKDTFGGLPESYALVTSEFNKPGPGTDPLHVGNGAGVSPFCSVHQPLRSVAAQRITVGGKPLEVRQLGCKAASGAIGLSRRWLDGGGWSDDAVRKVLEENMCCYSVKVLTT